MEFTAQTPRARSCSCPGLFERGEEHGHCEYLKDAERLGLLHLWAPDPGQWWKAAGAASPLLHQPWHPLLKSSHSCPPLSPPSPHSLPRLLCLLHLLHHSCSHDGDKRVASTLPGGAWNGAGGQRAGGPQRREKGTTALSWALSTVTKAAFSVRATAGSSAWLL